MPLQGRLKKQNERKRRDSRGCTSLQSTCCQTLPWHRGDRHQLCLQGPGPGASPCPQICRDRTQTAFPTTWEQHAAVPRAGWGHEQTHVHQTHQGACLMFTSSCSHPHVPSQSPGLHAGISACLSPFAGCVWTPQAPARATEHRSVPQHTGPCHSTPVHVTEHQSVSQHTSPCHSTPVCATGRQHARMRSPGVCCTCTCSHIH